MSLEATPTGPDRPPGSPHDPVDAWLASLLADPPLRRLVAERRDGELELRVRLARGCRAGCDHYRRVGGAPSERCDECGGARDDVDVSVVVTIQEEDPLAECEAALEQLKGDVAQAERDLWIATHVHLAVLLVVAADALKHGEPIGDSGEAPGVYRDGDRIIAWMWDPASSGDECLTSGLQVLSR